MKIKGVGFVAIPGEMTAARERYSLLLTALAPVVPQIIGSAFNIWYNTTVIQPLLVSPSLKQRFSDMVVVYNSVVYPVGVLLWLRRIFSFRGLFHRLCAASAIDSASLARARRRLIHLPWFAAAICGVAWFLCIPVFIGALLQVQNPLDPRLLWHLPISFCVSGLIAVTHSFFLSVSRFLSWRACRSHPGRLHAFVARPRNLVGRFRIYLSDRFALAIDVRAAIASY